MRIGTVIDGYVHIVLSERNLRSLLAKLGQEKSERTIEAPRHTGDPTVLVSAEHDSVHYAGREPGPMHPGTEAILADNSGYDALDSVCWPKAAR